MIQKEILYSIEQLFFPYVVCKVTIWSDISKKSLYVIAIPASVASGNWRIQLRFESFYCCTSCIWPHEIVFYMLTRPCPTYSTYSIQSEWRYLKLLPLPCHHTFDPSLPSSCSIQRCLRLQSVKKRSEATSSLNLHIDEIKMYTMHRYCIVTCLRIQPYRYPDLIVLISLKPWGNS